MRAPFTIETIKQSRVANINPHITQVTKPKSKYGNKRVEFEGINFASKKECRVYIALRMRLRAGEISDLRLQVKYELNPGGTYSFKYLADFVFIENGEIKVADAKGYRTKVYLKKKKLMLKVYGIEIVEL